MSIPPIHMLTVIFHNYTIGGENSVTRPLQNIIDKYEECYNIFFNYRDYGFRNLDDFMDYMILQLNLYAYKEDDSYYVVGNKPTIGAKVKCRRYYGELYKHYMLWQSISTDTHKYYKPTYNNYYLF